MPGPRTRSTDAGRQRASHSMDAVLTAAVALLDEAGPPALTFRALAAKLGGGVASIYWYVTNKDELLDRAADHVVAGVLADFERLPRTDDAINDLRAMALRLFDVIVDRPWVSAYFMRNTDVQPNALMLYERIGEQALRLDLTARQAFHAVSAVIGFVIGIAADLGQEAPAEFVESGLSRDEFIAAHADRWRALDASAYPFLHHIADEFATHDDVDQFRAGLDLLLAGLRLQAESAR